MIRQFDVFENPSVRSRPVILYVAIMSSHFLDGIATVLVAPLVRAEARDRFTRVSVAVSVRGEDLMLSLPEMIPIAKATLGPVFESLADAEDDIRRSLDRLFTGF